MTQFASVVTQQVVSAESVVTQLVPSVNDTSQPGNQSVVSQSGCEQSIVVQTLVNQSIVAMSVVQSVVVQSVSPTQSVVIQTAAFPTTLAIPVASGFDGIGPLNPTRGQVIFNLPSTPVIKSIQFLINQGGLQYGPDYTVAGTVVSLQPDLGFSLDVTDYVQITYEVA